MTLCNSDCLSMCL